MLFHKALLINFLHESLPLFVDACECCILFAAFFFNFLASIKDIIQIEPLLLAILPLFDRISNRDQLILLLFYFSLKAFDVTGTLNITDTRQRIIQDEDYTVPLCEYVLIALLLVLFNCELSVLPF